MEPREHQRRRRLARWGMQIAQRIGQRWPRLAGKRARAEDRGEIVLERLVLEPRQRARHDAAQRLLIQALGARIDGRQPVAGLAVGSAHGAVLRVNHLQAGRAGAHFSVAAHAVTARQHALERGVEVEEPQRNRAGTVGEPAQERAPAPVDRFAELDDAFDERFLAYAQAADRAQRRTVLVALRQQAEQVADRPHVELGEALGDLRPYARQALDRPVEERYGPRSDSGRLEHENAVDLDGRAARQLRDADRHARRIRLLAEFRHDLVDDGEVGEVGEIDRDAHGVRERAAGRLGDCREVLEYLPRLHADVALDELFRLRIERDLPRQIDRAAGANRLAVRPDRGGRPRRVNRFLRHAVPSSQLALRDTRTTPGIVRMLRTTSASWRRSRTLRRNASADASPSRSTRTCSMLVCAAEIRPATSASKPTRSSVRTWISDSNSPLMPRVQFTGIHFAGCLRYSARFRQRSRWITMPR